MQRRRVTFSAGDRRSRKHLERTPKGAGVLLCRNQGVLVQSFGAPNAADILKREPKRQKHPKILPKLSARTSIKIPFKSPTISASVLSAHRFAGPQALCEHRGLAVHGALPTI